MKFRHPLPGLAPIVLAAAIAAGISGAGCKKSDPIVGVWKNQMGLSVTFNADKTFQQEGGPKPMSGNWTLTNNTLSLTLTTVDGQSIDKVIDDGAVQTLAHRPSEASPEKIAQAKADAKKPMIFKLSDDGSTLMLDTKLPFGISADKVALRRDSTKS